MASQIIQLCKNSIIYGAGTTITRLINLFLLPLYTAYLSPKDYGILALLALLTMVGQSIFNLGLNAAIGPSYFKGNNARQKSETVWTTFIILFFSGVILIAIGWAVSGLLGKLLLIPSQYYYLISLALTGCALEVISMPFVQRIQFEEQAKKFVTVTFFLAILSIGTSVIAVVILGWGIFGMVLSQFISQTLGLLIFASVGARETRFGFNRSIAGDLLRLGIPLIPSFAFLYVLLQSNRYFLQYFEGLETVGIYSIGFGVGTVLSLVVGAISTAWYPFFMSFTGRQNDAEILFGRIFTYYVFFTGTLCALFFAGSKLVISLATQPAFHSAYMIVGFAASAQFFIGIFNMLLPGMYYTGEVKYVSLVQGITAVFSILLNIVFIKWMGLLGAGIALSLSHLLMAVFQYLWNLYRRKEYVKVRYEWLRLSIYFSLFIIVSLTSMIDRHLRMPIEASYFALITLLFIMVGFFMLTKNERLFLKKKLFANKRVKVT
jgi:O-antigen/teichoic acid export membrane protein